jgi:PKD repeat protein
MKTKYIALLAGMVILFSECKKNEYSNTSTSTQPVFSFNGSINNAPVTIQAGINNYAMNTSYATDSVGVYDFTGIFEDQSCSSNCPNSLAIYFKENTKPGIATKAHIDSLLSPGYFSYATPVGYPTGYYVPFVAFVNGTATNYLWNYGDGQTYNGPSNNPHYYAHPGVYTANVTITATSGTLSDTCMVVVGQAGSAFITGFSYTSFVGTTTTFGNVSHGISPYTYLWNFGDGHTSTAGSPTYTYASTGIYRVTSYVTDATGFTNMQQLIAATQSAVGCSGGFYEQTPLTPNPNPLNLNDVGVEWRDGSGVLWKSEHNSQHGNSLFMVTATSDYKNNLQNQAVKMVTVQMSCELYNGTDSISLKGTSTFGVAHY